jgi:hypothetical protein
MATRFPHQVGKRYVAHFMGNFANPFHHRMSVSVFIYPLHVYCTPRSFPASHLISNNVEQAVCCIEK